MTFGKSLDQQVKENGDWTPHLPLKEVFAAKKRKAVEEVIDIDD
jgi:hypothetical protein